MHKLFCMTALTVAFIITACFETYAVYAPVSKDGSVVSVNPREGFTFLPDAQKLYLLNVPEVLREQAASVNVNRFLALYEGENYALSIVSVLPESAVTPYNLNLEIDLTGVHWPSADIRRVKLMFWNNILNMAPLGEAYEIGEGDVSDVILIPEAFRINVDGHQYTLGAYILETPEGNRSFLKIRDIAFVLTQVNSRKKFSLEFDGSVQLKSGENYIAVGDEMGPPGIGPESPGMSTFEALLDGEPVNLPAYIIGEGRSYIGLRDMAANFDFWVGWTEETGITIDTTRGYEN